MHHQELRRRLLRRRNFGKDFIDTEIENELNLRILFPLWKMETSLVPFQREYSSVIRDFITNARFDYFNFNTFLAELLPLLSSV